MYNNPNVPDRREKERVLVNENIRFSNVMLIGPNGEKLGIKSRYDAQRIADDAGLDLFCVAPNAEPPVCKILDYGKFRFDQLKKEKENRKNQKIVLTKEQRLSPVISGHDLETKAKNTNKWLLEGDKVKIVMKFRGRQITHVDIGEEVMNKFIELCVEGILEKKPVLDGKVLIANLNPKVKK